MVGRRENNRENQHYRGKTSSFKVQTQCITADGLDRIKENVFAVFILILRYLMQSCFPPYTSVSKISHNLDCFHTMPANVENGEKCDGSTI